MATAEGPVPKGLSVLEASLRDNVPHACVCGGRARCSTCRIRIIGDHAVLPEPSQREAFVCAGSARRSFDPACLAVAAATDLSFFQLFLPHTMSAAGRPPIRADRPGALSRQHVRRHARLDPACRKALPFDTVFIVNRFLGAVSQAVPECGGRPNQFVGDGMLALFGLPEPPGGLPAGAAGGGEDRGQCRRTEPVSQHDLHEPIRFGIGIHGGEVIVGDIGYRDHMVFTALGDAVNVAARLQDMTKPLHARP